MLKLAPSILSADFSKLGEEILTIEKAGAHYIHIDVMDGHFVPNISIGLPVIKSIRPITDMTFDVHLMIAEPEKYLEAFAQAGADIINVHAEVCPNLPDVIHKIKRLNKRAAVTVKPKTPIEPLFDIAQELDLILIMSVEPGFGGQDFITDSLRKAEDLANFISKNNLLVEIEMDGGIYLNNVRQVLDSGVNVIVAGSAIFKSEDPGKEVKNFYNAFKQWNNDQA